jgi:hypothetical protein
MAYPGQDGLHASCGSRMLQQGGQGQERDLGSDIDVGVADAKRSANPPQLPNCCNSFQSAVPLNTPASRRLSPCPDTAALQIRARNSLREGFVAALAS